MDTACEYEVRVGKVLSFESPRGGIVILMVGQEYLLVTSE